MDELDQRIFNKGTDLVLDARDSIEELVDKWLDDKVAALTSKFADRSEVIEIEIGVAMLYRHSLYFGNNTTKKTDAMLWRHQVLTFFDSKTQARGDGKHHEDWRLLIEENFDRLIGVLTI